jgi:hypothetical protein
MVQEANHAGIVENAKLFGQRFGRFRAFLLAADRDLVTNKLCFIKISFLFRCDLSILLELFREIE